MPVTVSLYNQTSNIILAAAFGLASQLDKNNQRLKLLTNAATFNPAHTTIEQVDGGSKAAFTVSIASPGVITDNAHGFSAGQPWTATTTGALPTGLTPGTTYFVINPTTNTYQLALVAGGSAINTSGSQSGTQTRYASGANELYGNGWPAGGITFGSLASAAAALTDAVVNDAQLSAANPSVTAAGGPLPPNPAYKSVWYDAPTGRVLQFVDFGQAQQAGITTDFKFLINAAGLLNLQAA
jgi:hypothetical protein